MPQIFISYKNEDRERAAAIADALEASGFTVWWDRALVAGDQFRRQIAEALANADCVVAIWSESAVTSGWVLDEADNAAKRGILLPITIDGTQPPLGFQQYQTIDLRGWFAGAWADPQHPDWRRVVERAQTLIAASGGLAAVTPARKNAEPLGNFLGAVVTILLLSALLAGNATDAFQSLSAGDRHRIPGIGDAPPWAAVLLLVFSASMSIVCAGVAALWIVNRIRGKG